MFNIEFRSEFQNSKIIVTLCSFNELIVNYYLIVIQCGIPNIEATKLENNS